MQRGFAGAAAFVLACTLWVGVSACSRPEGETGGRQEPTLRMGLALQTPSALAIVASERDLFTNHGLNVEVKTYPSGKRALNGLLAGEVDVATTAEVPIVLEMLAGGDICVLATIGSGAGIERVVYRTDAGIAGPADLRGKRIGTQRASAVHFFLHMFLLNSGLTESDVELVFMQAEDLPKALADGSLDAFCMREPYISMAGELLGARARVFRETGLYYRTEHLVAGSRFDAKHPDVYERLLTALLEAERLVHRAPGTNKTLVAGALGLKDTDLDVEWLELDLRLSLDQSLLNSLEDEARWAIESGVANGGSVPNFLNAICDGPLRSVKPDVVTIIR